MIEFPKGRKERGKNMNRYTFNFTPELQQPACIILDHCYNSPYYKDFTFYLHYDDAKLVHGDMSEVLASKTFMLDCKVWKIIEDWVTKEVWLETH